MKNVIELLEGNGPGPVRDAVGLSESLMYDQPKQLDEGRALDILDALQGGQVVEVPPGDGPPHWDLSDLLQLAGACLHMAQTHPNCPGTIDQIKKRWANERIAAYAGRFAEIDTGGTIVAAARIVPESPKDEPGTESRAVYVRFEPDGIRPDEPVQRPGIVYRSPAKRQ